MKTVVFITGTNAVGKSTLALKLIERFRGIAETGKTLTVCKDRRVCLAGPYDPGKQYGGVDSINNTRSLPDLATEALKTHDVFICEGSMLDTFGPNLVSTIYQGDRRLVVCLVALHDELRRRLAGRSGGRLTRFVIAKQDRVLRAAKKYRDNGCDVVCYNTGALSPEQIADDIQQYIFPQ